MVICRIATAMRISYPGRLTRHPSDTQKIIRETCCGMIKRTMTRWLRTDRERVGEMEGAEKSGKLAPAQIKLPHWSLSISGGHTCERGEFRLRFMVPLGRVKPLGRAIKDSSVNYFVHKKLGSPNSQLRRQCHNRFRQIRAFYVYGSTYDSHSFPFQPYQSFNPLGRGTYDTGCAA